MECKHTWVYKFKIGKKYEKPTDVFTTTYEKLSEEDRKQVDKHWDKNFPCNCK